MANRFPLILDTTDGNKIKELPAADNLDLRENSIVNVQNIFALGTINAANITVNGNKLVAQNFADLTDTPNTFAGSENYFVKVNETGSGIEFRPLDDIGTINVADIVSTGSLNPSIDGTGSVGTSVKKWNVVTANELVGDLVSYSGSTVFDATTGRISYAALQGAPAFLSEFQDDIGYLRQADLDSSIANLFDEGRAFESDIKGSVFADDSTILVDGISGRILAPVDTTTVDADQITASSTTTSPTVNTSFVEGSTGQNLVIEATGDNDINIGQNNTGNVNLYNTQADTFGVGTGLGVGELFAATDLLLDAENRIKIANAVPFKFSLVTADELALMIPQNGDVVYNTTTDRFQMYQNNSWKDVNGNVEATTGESNFNDVVIAGDLTVSGTTTTVDTENTTISDNVIILNEGEEGAGVTAGTSGIEIDRGTETNKTFVWDDSVDKWSLGSETLAAGRFESVGVAASVIDNNGGPLQIKAGAVDDTGNTILINPYGDGTYITMQSENYILKTGPYLSTTDPYIEFTTAGAFKTYQGAYFDGNLIGDVTGSVFADDSTMMVDAVGNVIVADSAIFNTLTVPDITGTLIQPVAGATITIGNNSTGTISYNDTTGAINATSTGGVTIAGAASASVNIGTGTSGATTIGHAGNVVSIPGTLDLGGATVNNATFDLTGNIDNTTLDIGTTATTVNVGNATSTTNLLGNVTFDTALIVANITADDSISILTEGNSPNEAISLGPQGSNTAINLTADNLRFNGTITTTINADGGVEGDLKGSVYADDSSVLVDGVNARLVGDVHSNLIRTPEIKNLVGGTDIDIEAQGFLELLGGAANAGLSKIQLDTAGINYIELQTTPNTPGDVNDTANILINGQIDSGDVTIGNAATTRNQTVEIFNATVTGDLIGTVTGSLNGTVTGDVNGSIYADDSTLLVDGVNGTIPWSVITGFTGGGQEEYDVFATSLSAASSANVTAGSFFRNEADTADIAVSASVTSGFSKMKVMLSANIHNPTNTNTEAVVRLERSVNGGAGTTVKRFVFPAGSNYYGGVEFMFVDDHGQSAGSLIEYKLVNDMANGYSSEDLRMWYGISGDTFGLKEIV